MRLKKRTPSLALVASAIFLVSCSSCNHDFDWNPRPYVGDSVTQSLYSSEGEVVRCDQVVFDSFTCFDPVNIAELRSAIGQVTNKKERKNLEDALKTLDTRAYYSKENRAKSLDLAR